MSSQVSRLLEVMRILRSETGCPWDREQTHESLVPNLIEETYEVVDAITTGDLENQKEELGDLLFQIVFHAELGRECGHYNFEDIAESITEKLIRRHPHVEFPESLLSQSRQKMEGLSKIDSTGKVVANWEKIKEIEKKQKANGMKSRNDDISVLDSIPKTFPPILRSHKISKTVAKFGFEWETIGDLVKKLQEELEEVSVVITPIQHLRKTEIAEQMDAVATNSPTPTQFSQTREKVAEELGDLLFTCVNLARWMDLETESIFRNANAKFEKRFRLLESFANSENNKLENLSPEEWNQYWEKAKAAMDSQK